MSPRRIYDWKHLLARCDQWGRNWAEWEQTKGYEIAADRLPMTFAPAIEAQIAREEARLGVRLPPSLKSFYLQTNGHGRVGNFIWAVRSVEQIGWLRDVQPHLYGLTVENDPEVARSLVVSGEADASWWLLDPGEVDRRGEWRAGRWSSWYPGINWIAGDFFGLFEDEVSSSEQLLASEQFPTRPVPGAGRPRNEFTVGIIDNSNGVCEGGRPLNGYMYVPAEGFTSVVTASAPSTAKVGEWVVLHATRRNGPWNPVRQNEVRPQEISLFEPRIVELEVASNLTWSVDPRAYVRFDTGDVAGVDVDARCVMFHAPGVYTLQGFSAFPLPVVSNAITIRVE